MDDQISFSAPPPTQEVFKTSNANTAKNRNHKHLKQLLLLIIIVIILPVSFLVYNQFKKSSNPDKLPQKFQLTESSPSDQENTFSTIGQPTFVFSKKIGVSEKDLGKYFKISPSTLGSWHLEKNGQVVYFSSDKTQPNQFANTLSFNTVYTVTINKDFHSTDNQDLSNETQISFRTKQNPLFNIQSDKKLIATTPNQALTIGLNDPSGTPTNSLGVGSPLTISIQTANQKQLLQYFSYKEGKFPLYQFITNSDTNQKQTELVVQNGNSTNTYQVQLANDAFPNPGLYFVTLKNENGSEDFFVAASNHINQVFNDPKSIYVWASEQNSGKSISGVTSEFYSAKNTPVLLDKNITDNDGIAKSVKSANDVDFIITHKEDDTAITFTKSYGYNGYSNSGGDRYQVFSYSDRPVYRPGDTVHYKAVLRKKDNGAYIIPNGTYYAQILVGSVSSDLNNNYKSLEIDQNGTVTFDAKLPKQTIDNYPEITLSTKNPDGTYKQIDSLPLNIQSYRKPDMDITATSPEKEYISSDSAHFTVFAKTNYGQPLSNIDFSYRVLASDFQEVKNRTTEDIDVSVSGNYGFGNELVAGKGKFNEKGVAQITFSTTLPSKYDSSQIATLEITPNIGAAPSIGKIAKLIHRGEFALFIDNLTGDTDKGITGAISVLNHDLPRQAVNNKSVELSLYKITDYSKKDLLQTQTVTSNVEGKADFTFQKLDQGIYEIISRSVDNRTNVVSTSHRIYLGQQQSKSSESQDSINLKTQKSSYKVNDTANIVISANFQVKDAIVILTNDGGNSSNIVSLSKNYIGNNSWALPIQIKDIFGQVVGVDVYTINKGVVVAGHSNIKIDKDKQQINTTISFDKQKYQPGDTVSATITTKNQQGAPVSADNSLSVIDASLLQIGQLNGDIFDSFYGYTPYPHVSHYDSTTGISTNIGGGGGGCFLEGTKILMDTGQTKNIENVQVGDKILTRASDTSPHLVTDTVLKTYRHAVTDYLTINNKLNVTWIHRIFINNTWKEAKDAKIGDTLLDENGNSIKITSITPHLGQFAVYNLTTSNYHTFFADGFYVHNDKGNGPRENFVDTTYWNAHIQTDSKGEAKVSFKLPDNLTTFTAQAFSNTKDSQFGQATANLISQKDFNIIPTISNFYYQGDKPIISAIIQNSSQLDVDTILKLTIKELGLTNNQALHISKGDFGTATFPIDTGMPLGNVSFLIEATDTVGNKLDSLLVKKPVLPKGNIASSWQSFQGSKNISFKATYPDLDFNKINLSVVPNVVAKLFDNSRYFSSEPSIQTGQNLYAYSYIFAKTRDDKISPTSYNYAKLKNQLRDVVQELIQNRSSDHWNLPLYGYRGESIAAMNLWLAQGFNQAVKVHEFQEITNISSIVSSTVQYVKSNITSHSVSNIVYSHDEELARQWILNENIYDTTYQKTPESLAISVLNGDQSALAPLRSSSLKTANDRYIWDGRDDTSQIFPVLALIQKGTKSDADKAIKGLSLASANSYGSPLTLLAGAMYAEKYNMYVDQQSIKISVNGQTVYAPKPNQQNNIFSQSFLAKNNPDGKITLKIETSGELPVYSTIVRTDYRNETGSSNTATDQMVTEGKPIDINLKRTYKDIETGQDIPEIKQGQAGIVVLSANIPFMQYLNNNYSQNNSKYGFTTEDAISPSFIYLNQTNEYSSSPQYQSVINKIFPSSSSNYGSAITPSDYSDQAVFFNSYPSQSNLILPYVVYNASGGTYYQPKTSIVFPTLGVVAQEK